METGYSECVDARPNKSGTYVMLSNIYAADMLHMKEAGYVADLDFLIHMI